MDIALERNRGVERRFMSLRFEVLAGQTLIFNKGCIEIKVLNDFLINFMHLIIECLGFRQSISQTPRAGEIIEISTPLLSRENIKHNRLTKSHEVLGIAN